MIRMRHTFSTAVLMAACLLLVPYAAADHVILDDCIIVGSTCIGQDCVNGESFGFDTLRLKENNLRIKFQDTSSTASFPRNDWQITANDSSNGGAEKFSIDDIDGGRTPFTLEAGAPSHSLYVDDGGRLGFGTSTPVVELHVVDGDTPTLRLEQDGSSGFTPQTWDVAGNETNFFVRDVTNGSRLPLRIRPNAPSNSIFVDTDGDVGMGTSSPSENLHVRGTDGSTMILVEEASGTNAARQLLELRNNGQASFRVIDTAQATAWIIGTLQGSNDAIIDCEGASCSAAVSARFFHDTGNLRIGGSLLANNGADIFPDYVFESDYELIPLEELGEFVAKNKHLPEVMSSGDVEKAGSINMTKLQLQLLKKVEELTLYTLQQQEIINELRGRLEAIEK